LLAVGDDDGIVSLYNYPCTDKNASARQLRGHGAHVTRVRFSHNDKFLVSISGDDRTMLVWEKEIPDDESED
jgi:WD40 repeat protein